MAVGYDERTGTTVYESSLPPKAQGIGVNTVLACVSAGVVAGLALFGLHEFTDHFQGAGQLLHHGSAHALSQIGSDQGAIQRTANDFADAAKNGVHEVHEQVKNVAGAAIDNVHGILDIGHSELGTQLTAISGHPGLATPDVQHFLQGHEELAKLANGDYLLRVDNDHGQVLQIVKDKLQHVSPEVLNRQPLIKELYEDAFGKPFDFGKAGEMALVGGGIGLGAAGIAQATITPPSANQYMQASSVAHQWCDVSGPDSAHPAATGPL